MLTGICLVWNSKKDSAFFFVLQFEGAQTELSDLKEKLENSQQEKHSLLDQLEECKASLSDIQEKGSKVSADTA